MPQDQILSNGQLLTTIHFVYWDDNFQGGSWRLACIPNVTEFHKTQHHENYQRTNDTRATTCPACKRTVIYAEHQRRIEGVRR